MIAPIDPPDDLPGEEPDEEFEVDPTPEVIRQRALAISRGWSERTRRRRRVAALSTWAIPWLRVSDFEVL